FFFQAEDGIRDWSVTGVQTCALPILARASQAGVRRRSHGRDRRAPAAGAGAPGRRSAPRAPQDAAPVLSREALALRARQLAGVRSEERRVGEEGRSGWGRDRERQGAE